MKNDDSINVRLNKALKARGERIAAIYGLGLSDLIRMLLDRFAMHADKTNGRIVMPPEFKEHEIYEVPPAFGLLKVAEGEAEKKTKGKK